MKIFIENSSYIDSYSQQCHNELFNMQFIYDKIITSAYQNSVEVLEDIMQANEIYADTSFLGDGGRLMDDLSYFLLQRGIKGKKLFIFKMHKDLCLWRLKRASTLRHLLEDNEMFVMSSSIQKAEWVKFNPDLLCNL